MDFRRCFTYKVPHARRANPESESPDGEKGQSIEEISQRRKEVRQVAILLEKTNERLSRCAAAFFLCPFLCDCFFVAIGSEGRDGVSAQSCIVKECPRNPRPSSFSILPINAVW